MAKDLFSNQAKDYVQFRPVYPQSLFDFIYTHMHQFERAWDCGTGNGQVARALALKFQKVYATDISEKQIENAWKSDNIHYCVNSAEQPDLAENNFDLITVGQAIHWFDRDKFYSEVKKVAKPDALFAAFGYSLVRGNPEFDKALDSFYYNVIYPYWDAERKLVDDQYRSMTFPFDEIQSPSFSISLQWSLMDLYGYISTWSAIQKYILQNSVSPVDDFIEEVKPFWKKDKETVYFPVFLRMGRVNR